MHHVDAEANVEVVDVEAPEAPIEQEIAEIAQGKPRCITY